MGRIIRKVRIPFLICSLLLTGCSEGNQEFNHDKDTMDLPEIYSWYVDDDDAAIITEVNGDFFDNSIEDTLIVPSKIEGHRVKAVGGFCMGNYPSRIILSKGIETICRDAFSECAIEEIYIPSTVSVIEDLAFSDCPELKKIVVEPQNDNYMSENGVLYSKDRSELICCPEGVFSAGECYYVADGVKIVRPGAFSGGQCNDICIIFPNSLSKVLGSAFYFYDSTVDWIILPDKVSIEDEVFYYIDTTIFFRGFPSEVGENTFREGTEIYFDCEKGKTQPYVYHTREELMDFLDKTYGVQISIGGQN